MLFEQLNNKRLFDIEVKEPVYKKLSDFTDGAILQVWGMYTNKKSVYGDTPIFIVQQFDGGLFFVNMPFHHLQTLNTIISNSEMVKAINNGECFVKIESYFNTKYKKNCFDFSFCEKPLDWQDKEVTAEQEEIF